MKNWAIRYEGSDRLVGYTQPLVFKTKKEARKRLDRLSHMVRGGSSLMLVQTDLPVNCGKI